MILKSVTPPAVEPVTIEDMEGQVRLPGQLSAEQSTVELIIAAVRESAEEITNRALITQTWELVLDSFPSGRNAIFFPKPPLQTVDSIKYLDEHNVEQTLDSMFFRIVADSEPGYAVPLYGLTWPATMQDSAVVRIKFTCGYGDEAADVPASIKQWILLNAANLFENRETVVIGNSRENVIDTTATLADGLLASKRMYRL